jgi:hypothetical protein
MALHGGKAKKTPFRLEQDCITSNFLAKKGR